MADSVDPDKMAHYDLSHLDLQCLHRCWFWFARLKGLKVIKGIVHGITRTTYLFLT